MWLGAHVNQDLRIDEELPMTGGVEHASGRLRMIPPVAF